MSRSDSFPSFFASMSNLDLEPHSSLHLSSDLMNGPADQHHHHGLNRQPAHSHLLGGFVSHTTHVIIPKGGIYGSHPAKRQKLPGISDIVSSPPATTLSPAQSAPAMSVPTRRRNNSASSSDNTTAKPRPTQSYCRPAALGGSAPIAVKSKRTRTGCLTCRGRHLKCDEGLPDCSNCLKTNRRCMRGLKLNFMYMQVKRPPRMSESNEWLVRFEDESRLIASGYKGGLRRYASTRRLPACSILASQGPAKSETCAYTADSLSGFASATRSPPITAEIDGLVIQRATHRSSDVSSVYSTMAHANSLSPPPVGSDVASIDDGNGMDPITMEDINHESNRSGASAALMSSSKSEDTPRAANRDAHLIPKEHQTSRNHIRSSEEADHMQVFVEKVAVWMDAFDKDKHFGRTIPYQAFKSPMLLNSFLACGVQHLALVNPGTADDKALLYYDTATSLLLRSLQNPDRDMAECAVAAVALNVYEVMSERSKCGMGRHISGARALIRECGWNARSTGVGAACFWLNIGMEVLSCLSFGWAICWDPDDWGLDMNFDPVSSATVPATPVPSSAGGSSGNHSFSALTPTGPETPTSATSRDAATIRHRVDVANESEELWVHRIFYIVAKIANFRASMPEFSVSSLHGEEFEFASRLAQWHELKKLCGRWNACCPRTMHPLAYIVPDGASSGSVFPKIWLTVRASVIGRLFYHTAEYLLAQTKPVLPSSSSDQARVSTQLHHAHQVCGIVANATDPGVASVAIRSLAIAAPVLAKRSEQIEALQILDKIHRQSGWAMNGIVADLKEAWGWGEVGEGRKKQNPVAPCYEESGACRQPYQEHRQQMLKREQQQQSRQRHPQLAGLAVRLPSRPQAHVSHANEHIHGGVVELEGTLSLSTRPATNPLYCGDFSHPDHPYQNWYEPPNRPGGGGPFVSGAFF